MSREVQMYIVRICLMCLFLGNTIHLSDASSAIWNRNIGNITRYRRQLNCRAGKFQCRSGECIDEKQICDGRVNCMDSSDETREECSRKPSGSYYLPCRCLIPKNPQNGKYKIINLPEGSYEPDDYTIQYSVMRVRCNPMYKPNPPQEGGFPICTDGKWSMRPPTCSRSCPPIKSTSTRTAKCKHADRPLQTCDDPIEGTVASLECEPGISRNSTSTCRDGSWDNPIDECLPTTSSSRPRGCLIPENPQNGKYLIMGLPERSYKPGDYADQYEMLTLICNFTYKPNLQGVFPVCKNGEWTPPPPTCSRSCRPIISTSTTTVKCEHAGRPLQTCHDPIEGTIARFECEPFYEEPEISKNPIRICRDGDWDDTIPKCRLTCGKKRPRSEPNSIGGEIRKGSDYPWHVGVYDTLDKNYICGGSLVSQRVVLSAATCFTVLRNGDSVPKEEYLIAAGKYYKEYSDPRDEQAQYSNINGIYIPERYKGLSNYYEANVAVIILKNKLKITTAVQPVCVDRKTEFEHLHLLENNVGVVPGWGFTDDRLQQSEGLTSLNVLYKSRVDCFGNSTEPSTTFATHDKGCVSYNILEKKSFCREDIGAGLLFLWQDNSYYIRGIVSISPTISRPFVSWCDTSQQGAFTLVSEYIDFIDFIIKNR